jgi:hypothetical protein
MRAVLDEIEKEGAPRVEMYVASNQKHRFGAVCMNIILLGSHQFPA